MNGFSGLNLLVGNAQAVQLLVHKLSFRCKLGDSAQRIVVVVYQLAYGLDRTLNNHRWLWTRGLGEQL